MSDCFRDEAEAVTTMRIIHLPDNFDTTTKGNRHTLIHELGHIFGAEHVEDINSLMHEDFGYRTEFDAKNRAVIKKNRTCPFAK